jgi:hypothetical protein
MQFDILVETFISNLIEEGRTSNISKYSSINIDADKMSSKLAAGDFDILIKSWAGSPRYASLSEEQLKQVMTDVTTEITEMQPRSFDDLRDSVYRVVDKMYENKGARRKTYDERLTKAITNLILHKEYDLVSTGESSGEDYDNDIEGEDESSFDSENLTEIESAIYEFVKQADSPTSMAEVEAQFANSKDIVDSLIKKGFLNKEGSMLSVKEDGDDYTPILDRDEDDFAENPLEADEDITSTFKSTFGRSMGDDFEDAGRTPSWRRRGREFGPSLDDEL